MNADAVMDLTEAVGAERTGVGGKAAVLAELAAVGFAVPPGFVVTASAAADSDLDRHVAAAAQRCGGRRFAVRSSGTAEDLPDASYAGLYETHLDVPHDD